MKFLVRPTINDHDLITKIANDPTRSLRNYVAHLPSILDQYRKYIEANGNAGETGAPKPLTLPTELETLLKGYYAKPPNELAFIDALRGSATDVCPMCGGSNSSTIDHIFPQGTFAEFAFFSYNLVPACGCNSRRGDAYVGLKPGERVLHPYFDHCLKHRLVRAQIIAPDGNYERPQIDLCICVGAGHPAHSALEFHLDKVVKRTFIIRHLIQYWGKLLHGPEDYFKLPQNISEADMDASVMERLVQQDKHLGTPNNWDSMFFAGIAHSREAKQFLTLRTLNLRSQGTTRSAEV